jgi:hypothetical protein
MIRPSLRVLFLAVPLLFGMGLFTASSVNAQEEPAAEPAEVAAPTQPAGRTHGQPDLFYNYYVPGGPGGVPTAMYLAPRPVPPLVGHTYFTYQPLLPHEYMYQHQRKYYRYYDCGTGLTRTRVRYMRTPILDHFFSR